MYDELTEAFDEAEDVGGEVTGYFVMFFHSDGSVSVDAVTTEGDTEAARIVDELTAGFGEPVQ